MTLVGGCPQPLWGVNDVGCAYAWVTLIGARPQLAADFAANRSRAPE